MTPDLLLALPILIPVGAAALCAVLWARPQEQRVISVVTAFLHLAAGLLLLRHVIEHGVIASHFGAWPNAFAIAFAGDVLSAAMVVITGLMGAAIAVYALGEGARNREKAGFHPLYQGLIFGVTGAFLTGDLFNLYVWFEVMLVSSFGLLLIGGTRAQFDAGIKYVCLNLVGTMLFLIAVGLLYGTTGTLNMGDLARAVPQIENEGLVLAIGLLLLTAFGMKAAVFPLFYWLPASYHTTPMPIAAIFAGLLTKVGVYAIIRIFTLILPAESGGVLSMTLVGIAATTMITGVLGAAFHYDIRRILSFHIISQIGYMIMGLAIYTPLAVGGAVLYVIHHIVVKANLFLVAGIIYRVGGSFDLLKLGGLYKRMPWLGLLFLVPALSLAGIPPLSGFWSKLVVIQGSLEAEHYALAAVAAVVGLLTLFSMIKIWNEAFWKAPPADAPIVAEDRANRVPAVLWAPVAALAAVTLTIGLWTEPFAALSLRAGAELLDPAAYIAAVGGTGPTVIELAATGGVR